MRYAAWLNASQRDAKGVNLSSRLKAIKDDGGEPDYPPRPPLDYLVLHLYDVGPTLPGGMGAVPLTHSEIAAWQRNTNFSLSRWESQTLRRLSIEYLDQSQAAASPECPAPWVLVEPVEQVEEVGNKVQNAFRLLMATKPKK